MKYLKSDSAMAERNVDLDHWVTIRFTITTHLPDGTTRTQPETSVSFIFGVESQVPSLEHALKGASVGQKLQVKIPPEELYGDYDPSLVREIPKKGLIKQRVKKGQFYRQMKKGSLVSFKVLDIKPDTVVADFNPPMAGVYASMDVEVTAVKKASKDEINAAMEAEQKRRIGCG